MTTPIGEQRFHCNVCRKSWTGFKMEHCKGCHQTFNNTRAGDKHVVVESTYHAMVKGVPSPEISEKLRCLTPAEMREKGMNQEKNGAWNMGGKAYIPSHPVG